MATICATPFKVPRLRATRLDECGVPVEGECSTVVTDGTITVEIAREYEDREDFFKKNGDGVFCVKETDPPILKWINLTMTMCDVDPHLVNLVAGEEVLEDDATEPNAIGFESPRAQRPWSTSPSRSGRRTTGGACGLNETRYGYLLFPWIIEGTIGDLTLENGAADFVLTARTRSGSPWGVGPYTVQESALAATLGDPLPFYQIVGDLDHEEWIWTTLAPPVASCGCIAMPLVLEAVDSGVLTRHRDGAHRCGVPRVPRLGRRDTAGGVHRRPGHPRVRHPRRSRLRHRRLYPGGISSAAYPSRILSSLNREGLQQLRVQPQT